MSQNCAPHSTQNSRLPQTCRALDTTVNDTAMQTLRPRYQREGDDFLGRNLGSLKRTKLETSIKWMEVYRYSSYKGSAPYTLCCEVDVHCGVWHCWGYIAPRCTTNADGKRCLLLHFPARLRRKRSWYTTTINHSLRAPMNLDVNAPLKLHIIKLICREYLFISLTDSALPTTKPGGGRRACKQRQADLTITGESSILRSGGLFTWSCFQSVFTSISHNENAER